MRIAGFVPLSLCDFPGRVASVIFTQGCNFRCPWCHNGHLLSSDLEREKLIPEEEVLARLEARKVQVPGIVVSGGEPTVQPDLTEFLQKLKDMGMEVKLDTNGSRPDLLKLFFERHLVDFVAMDIKAPWSGYARLVGLKTLPTERLRESVRLIAASGVEHQFRTTRVDPLLDADDYEEILRQIPEGSPHVWQKFRPEYSLDPALRPPKKG